MQNLLTEKKTDLHPEYKKPTIFQTNHGRASKKHTPRTIKKSSKNVIEKEIEKILKNHEKVTPKSIKKASKNHSKID